MNYINAQSVLTNQFGWEVTENQEEIQVVKPDGETENMSKEELILTATEMWNTAKQNGLDPIIVEEVEEAFLAF